VSYQAVEWAVRDAPMLLTDKGKPDTTARHVLAVLAEAAHSDGSEARPAVVTMQYRTGYDRRTIQRALRRLESGGLIRAEGTKFDCTIYRLAMHLKRPASDLEDLKAEEMRQKELDAERQRRSRARRVTHSDDVTVTDAECVTEPDVTDADDVSHALSVPTSRILRPDVTDATPPNPSFEPSGEPSLLSSTLASVIPEPRAVPDEKREIIAALPKDNDDAAKVVEAWLAARGRGRNPAAEANVRKSASEFLAADWSIPDLIALAEDMGRRQPTYSDLTKHEPHWVRPASKSAPAASSATTCWTCTRPTPKPVVAFGRTYCPSCCEPCSGCRAATPADLLDMDTNRCASCRTAA